MTTGPIKKENMIKLSQDSCSLRPQLKSLLSNHRVKLDERYLVALTLINDGDQMIDDYPRARELFYFCIRLIRTQNMVFVRLACKWLSETSRYEYQWSDVVPEVLKIIKNRIGAPIIRADDDLLYVVALSARKDKSLSFTSNDFDIIWNRFSLGLCLSEKEDGHNVTDPVILFMNSVIEKSITNENESTWMIVWWEIWQYSAPKIALQSNRFPQWYQSMLLFTADFHTSVRPCIRWHDMALNFSATSIAYFSDFDSMSVEAIKALIDIITVNIAHPRSDLLSKAWSVCCLLVSRHGWDSIMRQPYACTKSSNSTLCIWTRLASGEYRIQLSLAIDAAASFNLDILTSVSHVITQSIEKVINEANVLDNGQSATLGNDAILHFRTSVLDVLEALISYFELTESPLKISCKVLGCILHEMSLWDEGQSGMNRERILKVLSRCIACKVIEILPCLSSLLDIDVADHEKILSLHQTGVLGVELFAYFIDFWVEKAFENVYYISWACSAIEVWSYIAQPPSGAKEQISGKIISWLKEVVGKESMTIICPQIILSVVDCYAILNKDKHPFEDEAALISLALSLYNHDSGQRRVFRNKSNPVPANGSTKLSI
jgi:hypothetical protein